MRTVRTSKRGFTLVELMIVVAIVGVLAALAIYGVRRYILNAKTAEVRNSIGQMAKDASTAYNREGMAAAVLLIGNSTGISNRLCGSATNTVPAAIASVKAQKYQSTPTEWTTGDKDNGWQCVKFSMQDPQYYMYSYAGGGSAAGSTFTAGGAGDLDGDGTGSGFSIAGEIQSASGKLVVTIAPNIEEVSPDE